MQAIRSLAATAVLLAGVAGQAQAALLADVPTNNFPNTSATGNPYLLYDHDGYDATTGTLKLVAGSANLAEGVPAGNATATESYFGTGDTVPDLMLTLNLRNGTGGYTAGELVSGSVSIGFGNSTTANRWQWNGTVVAVGSQTATSGTILNAKWTVSSDSYQNMASNLSQFVNGYLTGGAGGISISNSVALGTFSSDWVVGSSPSANTNLNSFRTGMTSPIQTNSTVTASFFAAPVPEPEQAWMLLAGLGLVAPLVRARRTRQSVSQAT